MKTKAKNIVKWSLAIFGLYLVNQILQYLFNDYIEKLLGWFIQIGLWILSIGITNFEEFLYQRVARGLFEYSSSLILIFLMGVATFPIVGYLAFRFGKLDAIKKFLPFWKELHELENEFSTGKLKNLKSMPLYEEIKKKETIYERKVEEMSLLKSDLLFGFTTLIVFLFLFSQAMVVGYATQAVGYFNQNLNIIKPYIDEMEEEKILSEFSQIKNRDNYVQVIKKMDLIAQKNNVNLPEFTIF